MPAGLGPSVIWKGKKAYGPTRVYSHRQKNVPLLSKAEAGSGGRHRHRGFLLRPSGNQPGLLPRAWCPRIHPPRDPSNSYFLLLWSIRITGVVLAAQSCQTLCDPMDYSLPGSSVHGILQARILEWVAISSFRGSSWPRDRSWVSCIAERFLTVWESLEISPKCSPQGPADPHYQTPEVGLEGGKYSHQGGGDGVHSASQCSTVKKA